MGVAGIIGKVLKNNKMGVGTVANVAMGGYFGLDSYQEAKENGSGTAGAIGAAAMDTILPAAMGFVPYLAYEAVTHAPEMAMAGMNAYDQYSRGLGRAQRNAPFANSQFNDTEQVYTMRQAGMAIAQRSKYNMQQARMGREAQFMMK